MFYDPNGGNGWLVSKLKARRAVLQKATSVSQQNDQININSDYDPRNDIEILQTIPINQQNMKEIEHKLRLTFEYRRNLFNDKNISLLEYFPYFFHHSQLV